MWKIEGIERTKGILKELIKKNLVLSKISEGKRYYWIAGEGRVVKESGLMAG